MHTKWIRSLFYVCLLSVLARGTVVAQTLEKVSGDRVIVDLKYNTDDNFLHKNVYAEFGLHDCYVHPDVHAKLKAIYPVLKQKKLKLVMFDCYRPLSVQRKMWAIMPDPQYVADPAVGSNHNRGVAIDVTLATENGKHLPMPTPFDDFTEKASRSFPCAQGKLEQRKCRNRALLEKMLYQVGMTGLPSEWWHFELPNAKQYSVIESLK